MRYEQGWGLEMTLGQENVCSFLILNYHLVGGQKKNTYLQ